MKARHRLQCLFVIPTRMIHPPTRRSFHTFVASTRGRRDKSTAVAVCGMAELKSLPSCSTSANPIFVTIRAFSLLQPAIRQDCWLRHGTVTNLSPGGGADLGHRAVAAYRYVLYLLGSVFCLQGLTTDVLSVADSSVCPVFIRTRVIAIEPSPSSSAITSEGPPSISTGPNAFSTCAGSTCPDISPSQSNIQSLSTNTNTNSIPSPSFTIAPASGSGSTSTSTSSSFDFANSSSFLSSSSSTILLTSSLIAQTSSLGSSITLESSSVETLANSSQSPFTTSTGNTGNPSFTNAPASGAASSSSAPSVGENSSSSSSSISTLSGTTQVSETNVALSPSLPTTSWPARPFRWVYEACASCSSKPLIIPFSDYRRHWQTIRHLLQPSRYHYLQLLRRRYHRQLLRFQRSLLRQCHCSRLLHQQRFQYPRARQLH